jgi:2-keto-4-pentenoate hydratase/2-oxohepta-3-ene-1,7-dioic acid hydratase in catechol pathway
MRYARLRLPGRDHARDVFAILDTPSEATVLSAAPWAGGTETSERIAWDAKMLLAPVMPSKILCVGRNYAAHAKELGNEVPKEPLLFLKPSSSVLAPGGFVRIPLESARVEHEAELGVVIKTTCKSVAASDALSHVLGYTCVGDITARDLQKSDGQWSRAKGFDTFCPVGPWIESDLDPSALRVVCRVNGTTKQDGNTSQMMFPVADLIAYASRMMTLEPGDLLVTGTPEGVGPLVDGDRFEIEIEGVGTLACGVVR